MINILEVILKVMGTFVLFALLMVFFKAIGMVILNTLGVDTSLTVGANIEASVIIFSFLLALFLAIQSYRNRVYLKWVLIGLFVSFLVLLGSIVTTKILLKSYEESNTSVEVIKN